MRYRPIDSSLFKKNRENFVKLLPENSIAIFHSNEQYPRNGDQYFPFRQQSDFFYLTGIDQEKSILIRLRQQAQQLAAKEAVQFALKESHSDRSGIDLKRQVLCCEKHSHPDRPL